LNSLTRELVEGKEKLAAARRLGEKGGETETKGTVVTRGVEHPPRGNGRRGWPNFYINWDPRTRGKGLAGRRLELRDWPKRKVRIGPPIEM